MDKKGTTSAYTMRMALAIMFLALVLFIVLKFIIGKGFYAATNTFDFEHQLLLNRVFYSTNSFFYYDSYTGRTNLEEVDFSKFNENTLKNLFGEEANEKISLKISLGDAVRYYNENLYDFIEEIHAKSEKYDITTKNKVVLVKYPDGREEKKLLIVNVGFEKTRG